MWWEVIGGDKRFFLRAEILAQCVGVVTLRGDGQTDGWTNGRSYGWKISPFYRILSPIGAPALLPPRKPGEGNCWPFDAFRQLILEWYIIWVWGPLNIFPTSLIALKFYWVGARLRANLEIDITLWDKFKLLFWLLSVCFQKFNDSMMDYFL